MIKKEFQKRFGGTSGDYEAARSLENIVKRYLSKHGYKLVFYVVNRILTKEKEQRSLEKDIRVAEEKLEKLKASRG